MAFQQKDLFELTDNVFQNVGKDWLLIAAEKDGKVNAMTASWGALGVLWHKNVAFVFIRKSRFTKEFVDAADTFSLNFPDPALYREAMTYFGRTSGRKEDKIAHTGFTVAHQGKTPYFEEASKVLVCRKLSRTYLAPEDIADVKVLSDCYPTNDYHYMYVGEITHCLVRE